MEMLGCGKPGFCTNWLCCPTGGTSGVLPLLFSLSMLTSSNENIFLRNWRFAWGIHRWLVNSTHKCQWRGALFFSCDQTALQMVFSVCPSVRLSHLFDYVPIIVSSWNFLELLPMTTVKSMQKVKVRGQRSRSQRSRPNLTVSGL